jgi:hypothetical protein
MAKLLVTCFRSRWFSAACLAVVVLSFLLPPGRGFGVPLCQFREMTGLPCLGCGLTRSFIDMARLHVERAAFYHPIGVVLFPLSLFFALLLPAPAALRERMSRWAETHPVLLNSFWGVLLVVFLAYGVGRMAWVALSHQPSPW